MDCVKNMKGKKIGKRWVYCFITVLFAIIFNLTSADAKTIYLDDCKMTTLYEYEGETIQLHVHGKQKDIKWKSSDKYFAIVTKTGRVRLKNSGSVWIKATYNGKTVKKKIVIKKPYIKVENNKIHVGEKTSCKL